MNLTRKTFGLAALPFGLLLVVAACSSSAKDAVATLDAAPAPVTPDDATSPADAAEDSGQAKPAKDATVDAPPPGECEAETTQAACFTCCTNKHGDGAGAYFLAVIDCMCVPGKCEAACAATLCDPDNPTKADGPCEACLTTYNSACSADIQADCTMDPECVAFDKCNGESHCPGK